MKYFIFMLFLLLTSAHAMTRLPLSAPLSAIKEGTIIVIKKDVTSNYEKPEYCSDDISFDIHPFKYSTYLSLSSKSQYCQELTLKKETIIILRNVKNL